MCTETKVNHGKECGLNRMREFVGMRCEVSINAHTHDNKVMTTYAYEEFDFDNGEFVLCLFDSRDESLNTRISKELIIGVFNLDNDVYNDVVHIYTKDFILSVTTLESKPILPYCDKCNKELNEHEHIWYVNQQAGYGSLRDGDIVQVKVCNNCFEQMFENVIL
jgi:hypothetical protein